MPAKPADKKHGEKSARRKADVEKLSKKPAAIRQRLRRNKNIIMEDLEMYQEVTGNGTYKPVEEWDFEELQKGKPRNADGGFKGRKPKWISPLIQEEISRRLREGVMDKIHEHAGAAVAVLVELLQDEENGRLRYDAAKLLLEYIAGKPEARVAIRGNVTLEHLLADVVVLDDGSPAHPVIDGQFEEADDDDIK